ncbi:MAG: sulfite exporter TauE/SafE family protein [Blastocatellia bacterium]|nr:sulfite exporter TauE/SafE family protein [Blastocatellia bacterium]
MADAIFADATMETQVFQVALIFGAAFAAGMINSVAGGGTLVSFPTLLWLGRDPIIANATNAIALWPGSLAGMLGFRRELAGSRRWMILLGAPSFAGGLVGAVLLLFTPSETFSAIVPYLILFATLLFMAGEPINRWLRRSKGESADSNIEPGRAWWVGAAAFQFFVAVYGGYFGAGIGIMMLAALSLLGLSDIHQMNGLKNFFALAINGVAAAYFIWSGAVRWDDAIVMAAGAIAGGYGGAGLARKLGRRFVRRAVIAIGLAMALSLLLRR